MAKDTAPKHVFVIDDTPAILDLFRELLEEAGYTVTLDTFSGDLTDELTRVQEAKPNLVILDFIIGGEGTGWQFLQMLKMDRATAHLPVIICTGAVRQVNELQGHLDEMSVAVVLKPFDIDHLLSQVERSLAGTVPVGS